LKAIDVDISPALTEGLNSIPSHYGDKGCDNGKVTGVDKGFAVAGRTFACGFIDGLPGFVMEPYNDAKRSGAEGVAPGLGKGVVGLVAKSVAGMSDVFAYPAFGILNSLRLS